jgi:hypothetical protein
MRRIRLRFALPVCHTLIDLLLLVACVRIAYIEFREAKVAFVWLQHYERTPWIDSGELYAPQPLAAISSGTLPISVIATLAFPTWLASSPFDLRWVGLHLLLGFAFWYILGVLGERAKAWRIGLVAYILFRVVTAPFSVSRWRSDWSNIRDIAFIGLWLIAIAFGLWAALAAVVRRRSNLRLGAGPKP